MAGDCYNRPVKKFTAALRALGILLGTWGLLFMVGAIAGVLPPLDGAFGRTAGAGTAADPEAAMGAENRGDAGVEETSGETAASDTTAAGTEATAPGTTDTAETADGGTAAATPGATPTGPARRRHIVCEGSDTPPIVDVVDPGNIIVGCGAEVQWLVRWPEGSDQLYRTLRVHREPSQPNARVSASAIAHGDVDGDGRVDLVVGFLERNAEGSTVGGALYLVAAAPGGGFAEPLELAPIPVTALALGNVNEHDALDVVALHRPDAFGRRPAEVWVFGGGASPARTARLDAGNALTLALGDIDRDEKLDILIGKESGTARVYFGDGTGHFERRSEVADAPGVELLTVDLDDDGGTDLLAFAEAARVVRGARAEGLGSAILEVPPGMRSVNPVDADGDGRRDLMGVAGDGIVIVRSVTGLELAPATLLDLPLHAGTPRMLWAARSEAGVRLVVLTRLAGDAEPFTLVLLSGVESAQVESSATVVTDAPLTLRFDVR